MGIEQLRQLFEVYCQARDPFRSESTHRNCVHTFNRFTQFLGDGPIAHTTVLDWVNHLKLAGMKGTTILCHMAHLSNFFRWLIDYGHWTERNPIPRHLPVIKIQPPHRITTLEEHKQIMVWLADAGWNEWWIAVQFGWEFGMRLGDAVSRKWGDIEDSTLSYTPIKTSRFGKQISLPLADYLQASIYSIENRTLSLYVTPNLATQYQQTSHRGLSKTFCRVFRKATGHQGSFKGYRHALVTRLVESGVNPGIVSSITGHSLGMIMRYAHPSLDTKRAALEGAV